ncbi:septation protein SepH [soil metagenome]
MQDLRVQDLTITGVENTTLLLTSEDGTAYRVTVDEVMLAKLRQSANVAGAGRKLAPRDIQAHIRSGMSAQDVAAITGAPLEYIQKFEGPVLAEREYVVNAALNVAVHTAMESDPLTGGSTFGTVIRERLYDLSAVNERWASWKEVGGGWIVKLAFTAEQIDHDARWGFEPRKAALFPLNNEAIALSQQGEMSAPLVPRLRAVGDLERMPDQSRFDSGAFTENELGRPQGLSRTQDSAHLESLPYGRLDDAPTALSDAAINRAPVIGEIESNQTADLLEALRRRRGERESALFSDEEDSSTSHPSAGHPSTGTIRLVDIPLRDIPSRDASGESGQIQISGRRGSSGTKPSAASIDPAREAAADELADTAPQPTVLHPRGTTARKNRATMPSWDEIVFGARSEEDEQPR